MPCVEPFGDAVHADSHPGALRVGIHDILIGLTAMVGAGLGHSHAHSHTHSVMFSRVKIVQLSEGVSGERC